MRIADPKTIEKEKQIVADILELSSTDSIEYNDIGWTSRVYMINRGEIVFKFAREEQVKKEYVMEVQAYDMAEGLSPDIVTPRIRWKHPELDYMGYYGVVGTPLNIAIAEMDTAERKRVGRILGEFFSVFHTKHIEGANTMPFQEEVEEYIEKLEMGLPVMKKHFSQDEMQRIELLIREEYGATMHKYGFDPVLSHADLGYWNIILGEDGRVGLIDFGDVGYYDRSIDFAGMVDTDLREAALDAYEHDVAVEKIEARLKAIPILDLPFFIGKEDDAGIERTVQRIRNISLG